MVGGSRLSGRPEKDKVAFSKVIAVDINAVAAKDVCRISL